MDPGLAAQLGELRSRLDADRSKTVGRIVELSRSVGVIVEASQ